MPAKATMKRGFKDVFTALLGGRLGGKKKRQKSAGHDLWRAQTACGRLVERETPGKAHRLHRWDPQEAARGILNPVEDVRYSRTIGRKSSLRANLREIV